MTAPTASGYAELALVLRSGVEESRHFGSIAAIDADGDLALALGDAERQVLPRSTAKPVQALGCLLAGAPLEGAELAIACGSHTGTDAHVALTRRILDRAGLGLDALGCPVDWPEDSATRVKLIEHGQGQARERMNCSGKHAAMLLACAVNGWDTATYLDPAHPLQQRIRAELERLTGHEVEHVAVDGCGAPLFSVSAIDLARVFRALVLAEPGTPERTVADAMRAHPFEVGGSPHVNTEAMERVPGLLAKGGAEGVIGMADADGRAVSMKIIDGNPRATTLIALEVLRALGSDVSGAGSLIDVPVLGGGVPVGRIELGGDTRAWVQERARLGTP